MLFRSYDLDATVFPGAPDVPYDGVDHACDGMEDDLDGDGFGIADDCNDNDASIHPGAPDVPYDGVDHACDGMEDDLDGDGFGIVDDCNDADASIHPDATEVWYDGIDQNCDGNDLDQDEDGSDADTHGGDDCDDLDPDVGPLAAEVWYDGFDQNCDGANDYDQDGDIAESDVYGGLDCNDVDPTIGPYETEIFGDGIDQDCSGIDLDGTIKDIDDVVSGTFVINEIHHDSLAVTDTNGEWFEIVNDTVDVYDINGITIQGASPAEKFTITASILVEPGGIVLFARVDDPLVNGGIYGIDWEYERAIEFSTTDQLTIAKGITFVDVVNIGPVGLTSPAGSTVSLDPDKISSVENGDKLNWCPGVNPYGLGDLGTPGQPNPQCP